MSQNDGYHFLVQVERVKLSRKVLYHFAIFAIVNEILITKNRQKLVFNNFLLEYYQPYRKIARDKNCLLSSHRALRIFSEFFINFLVLNFLIGNHFVQHKKIHYWKVNKKFWKNSQNPMRRKWIIFVSCYFFVKLIVLE